MWAALGSLTLLAFGCGREPETRSSEPVTASGPETMRFEPAELTLESCFEGELAEGSAHTYRLALEAGEYLHLGVDQFGVDVVVTVSGPPVGDQILRVDGLTGTEGVEHVFLVAEISGDHDVEIDAVKGAGRYQARVEALRQATSDDRRRSAAARAFSEALRLEEEPEAADRVAEHYREAADGWRELGDEARQARALYQLGKLYGRNARRPQAIEVLAQALALYHRQEEPRQEALTLGLLGQNFLRHGALERARRAYEPALPLWREIDVPREEASILNNLGLVAKRQGRIRPAVELYSQALGLWRRVGERRDQATTLSNLGVLYSMLGEHRRAIDFHRQALNLLDRRRNPDQVAVTLTKLGDALLNMQESATALEHYQEALGLRRERRDERGEAVTLSAIGWARQLQGRPREARESFQTALGIFRNRGELKAQATVLNNLGSLYESIGQTAQALERFEEALGLARTVDHRNAEAVALLGMGRVARRRDQLSDAQSSVEEALSVFESIRSAAERDDLRSAYLASKRHHYSFLVDLLAERHRRNPDAGFDARAFEASERARARGLLDALSEIRSRVVRGIDADDLGQLTELREEINARHLERLRFVAKGASKEETQPLDRELRRLLEERRQMETRLRRQSPLWAELVEPQILSLRQVQEDVLDDETLLLEYFLGEERSFLWAVTTVGSAFYELPDRETIERAALRVYATMIESHHQTGEVAARLAAEELSRILLAPVTGLHDRRRLLIVAPGALQYVPFAALPDPAADQPLVVDHEVISLPSASVLGALRRQIAGRPSPPGLIALLADPVFAADDERLRPEDRLPEPPPPGGLRLERLAFSRQEAEAILDLVGQEPTLSRFDFEASRELVHSGLLSDYRILHFSTHGVLDTEHPELSAIVLSLVDRDGRRVDGYLRAYEIFNLDLPADLVVLSACRTALGKEIRGEGLVGLTRAFMHAGAARVAVSLWNVSDQATAELMKRFYSYLLRDHLPPARALKQAQVSMWHEDRWQAPYYWAGFVLQGEWRAFDGPSRPPLVR